MDMDAGVMSPGKAGAPSANGSGGDHETASTSKEPSLLCEECEDRRCVWDCQQGCGGAFCDVCFYALHRKGKRALHKPKRVARPGGGGLLNGGSAGGGLRNEGGGLLSGLIGPRLPPKEEANPDMYDR